MIEKIYKRCPCCDYFIEIEKRDGIFRCQFCKNLLKYSKEIDKLYELENIDRSLDSCSCKKCGASINIRNASYSHMVTCDYCGEKYFYNAATKDIKANIIHHQLKHEERMADKKKELEQQRHEQKMEKKKFNFITDTLDNALPWIFIVLFWVCLFASVLVSDKKTAEKNAILIQTPDNIRPPHNDEYYINMTVEEAIKSFIDAGFTDVTSTKIFDKKLKFSSDELTKYVTIDDLKNFDQNDIKNRNSKVVIHYLPKTLYAPLSSNDLSKKTMPEAKQIFENAGFTNILTVEIEGRAGPFSSKNKVDHIVFGDKDYFTTSKFIDKDDLITIYYYSK